MNGGSLIIRHMKWKQNKKSRESVAQQNAHRMQDCEH